MMDKKEFALRRQHLAQQMLAGSVAILWAALPKTRSGDGQYFYRQESNFYYLTKFEFADSVCIITKNINEQIATTLVIPDKNAEKEVWTGTLYTTDEVIDAYGVDNALYYTQHCDHLEKLISECAHIYFDYQTTTANQQQIFSWVKGAQRYAQKCYLHPQLHDLSFLLKKLRYIKTPAEIALMRKASKVSALAHEFVLRSYRPGMSERDLELAFRSYCLQHGLSEMAYPPIVAGGKNACTLHYNNNNQRLQAGDLVLIDAGAEYEYYAADITRTWPVNGKFSEPQKILYEIVLAAQLAGIAQAVPGNDWQNIHTAIVEVLVTGLLECKLLTGTHADNVAQATYRQYYMHNFGHWLGIDTHDQGIWCTKENNAVVWQKLVPNMVLTMEPGLYISDKNQKIDPMWHNIGIRIEDDILITAQGNEVLTCDAPKLITELER